MVNGLVHLQWKWLAELYLRIASLLDGENGLPRSLGRESRISSLFTIQQYIIVRILSPGLSYSREFPVEGMCRLRQQAQITLIELIRVSVVVHAKYLAEAAVFEEPRAAVPID
ncbi:hypothetical protein Tco_0624051 [Tanacetum coccineum]|uniref:Uncharacterized protein n=1 Tax=Tanacetum coccineum TaxID=301880 RepID=A0ABQ4WCW5_9ASTR